VKLVEFQTLTPWYLKLLCHFLVLYWGMYAYSVCSFEARLVVLLWILLVLLKKWEKFGGWLFCKLLCINLAISCLNKSVSFKMLSSTYEGVACSVYLVQVTALFWRVPNLAYINFKSCTPNNNTIVKIKNQIFIIQP